MTSGAGWAGLGAGTALMATAPNRWDTGHLWLGAFIGFLGLVLILAGQVQSDG